MKRKNRAAVYDKPNTPFRISENPLRYVKDNEGLVKVTMSTICRSDINSYQLHRPNPCPAILGHEIIGIVEQMSSKIKTYLRGEKLSVGDRIPMTQHFHHGD